MFEIFHILRSTLFGTCGHPTFQMDKWVEHGTKYIEFHCLLNLSQVWVPICYWKISELLSGVFAKYSVEFYLALNGPPKLPSWGRVTLAPGRPPGPCLQAWLTSRSWSPKTFAKAQGNDVQIESSEVSPSLVRRPFDQKGVCWALTGSLLKPWWVWGLPLFHLMPDLCEMLHVCHLRLPS